MKKTMYGAFAVALLAGVLTLGSPAWGQTAKKEEPAASTPHKVGLIDMAHVFKHYKKFEDLREELKEEIAASEEKAKKMQADIADKQKEMKTYTDGSPEFTKAEQQVVKMAGDFESFRRAASREFLKKESQIYLQVYNETSGMVSLYAKKFKYTLVLRFNREDLDTENPQNLLQGMNRQVVYHMEEDDITLSVLKALNAKYAGATTPTTPGNTAPPRTTDRPKSSNKN